MNRQPHKKTWQAGTLTYTTAALTVVFLWLLAGDFAWMMKERAITPVAQIMLRGFQSPDWLVGLLVGSIPAAIGMILGPLISVRSDRHRGPRGRRIPYLLIPTPLVALTMFGLAATPALGEWLHGFLGDRSPGLMGSRLMVFTLFWTAFEIGTIVVNTLFIALINDVVPREVIGRFFALFRAVSLLAGILFNFFVMGIAEAHMTEIFLCLGVIYGVGFTAMCLRIREGGYPPPAAVSEAPGVIAPVAAYFRECFTKPFYIWFFIATTLGMIALQPVNTFSIFHARSVGMSDDAYGKCIALSYVISLVLTYPLGILADRFHPLRLGLAAMVLYGVVTFVGFLAPATAGAFSVTFLLHTVIAGAYVTGTASLAPRLLPRARFAQFASAATLTLAFFLILVPPALGGFIALMNHTYGYVFLLAAVVAFASAGTYFVLLAKFQKLGGDKSYAAPE